MSRATAVAVRLPLGEEDIRPTFRRERAAMKRGIWPVAGCDEAGRGPLAGPVVAAAVILDPKRVPRGLDDSKKLDHATREKLHANRKIAGDLWLTIPLHFFPSIAKRISRNPIKRSQMAQQERERYVLKVLWSVPTILGWE